MLTLCMVEQDHLLERVRERWLAAAHAAFAHAVPLQMLTAQLGFESDAEARSIPQEYVELQISFSVIETIYMDLFSSESLPMGLLSGLFWGLLALSHALLYCVSLRSMPAQCTFDGAIMTLDAGQRLSTPQLCGAGSGLVRSQERSGR